MIDRKKMQSFIEQKLSMIDKKEFVDALQALQHYSEGVEKANQLKKLNQRDVYIEDIYTEIAKLEPFNAEVVLQLIIKHIPVTSREEQKVKPCWQAHVTQCVSKGVTIQTVNDLIEHLNDSNVDEHARTKLNNLQPETLKRWAKECCPDLKFSRGRPKTKE